MRRAEFPCAYVTVDGTVVVVDRPPTAEQALVVVRRSLPEAMARQFVTAELANPGPGFVVFAVRPDRWLSFDFSDEPS